MASLASKHSISTASVHRPAPALLAPRVLPQRHCPVHTRSSLADKIKHSLDFNKKGRLEVIDKLYRSPSKASLEAVLAGDFKMGEEGYTKKFTKADYIGLTAGVVLPAIPDFNWGHACSGDVDDDGFCIVTVQATGHHTGAPLAMPGLEPLPPSGRHFCLAEEVQKVKVVGDKVAEIQVLPNKGAGPRALYAALGGKAPSQAAAAAAAAAPPLP